MTVRILKGDCRDVLRELEPESVHCVVTSPPYWGLRDYGTGQWEGGNSACDHLVRNDPKIESSTLSGGKSTTGHQREGFRAVCPRCGAMRVDRQIGLEGSFSDYVEIMRSVFAEVRRVLRKDGTVFLNLGDSYFSDAGKGGSGTFNGRNGRGEGYARGQRAGAYGKRGKEPASSQVNDCFCQSLCDACRAAYRIGKSHNGPSRASMPSASTLASNHDHRKPSPDHPPMSDLLHPDDHSVTAILDQQPTPDRAGEQSRAFLASTIVESASLLSGSRSAASNRDGECRLCGRSLRDCVPASVCMTDCTCDTVGGASADRTIGRDASGLAYPSYTTTFLKPKDLCGIPWRVAFALQNDGWYLRSDIIWSRVLAVYNSDGCVGRCDANCHDAKSAHCDCICGGKNHGAGLQKAVDNNRELIGLTPEDVQKFAEAHGYKPEELHVVDRIATKKATHARKQAQRALKPKLVIERPYYGYGGLGWGDE